MEKRAREIAEEYAKEGEDEGEAILREAKEEAEKLRAIAESRLENAVDAVLVRILGLKVK